MTMLINRKNDTLLQQAYAPYKARKAMKQSERGIVRQAYIDYTMSNKRDDGRKGKSFEVRLREVINPNTTTLKCQKQGLADLPIYVNGVRTRIECKTGGGEVCNNLWLENWRKDFDPIADMQFDYIAYVLEYNDDMGELWNDTVIMSKVAFIKWLSGYNGEVTGLLTYKTNEGRVMIGNPRASKKRKSYIEDLPNYAKNNSECYTLEEFMIMTNRHQGN